MGIGNLERDSLGKTFFNISSLPLMGIGNLTEAYESDTLTVDSLPLMGIGNGRPPGSLSLPRLQLITPHGDRKREDAAVAANEENLITPHGDRKRAAATRAQEGSMNLITPHGDRKPGMK